jgi:hypothetical protein
MSISYFSEFSGTFTDSLIFYITSFYRFKVYLVGVISAQQMRLLKHYVFMPK